MNQIRIIVKEPNEQPIIKYVEDNLHVWQQLIGGYIEAVLYNDTFNIIAICNEEGKLIGLQPNIYYYNDILVGTVVFVTSDGKGNFASLSYDQINYVLSSLLIGGLR
jgi:hypothetical protein